MPDTPQAPTDLNEVRAQFRHPERLDAIPWRQPRQRSTAVTEATFDERVPRRQHHIDVPKKARGNGGIRCRAHSWTAAITSLHSRDAVIAATRIALHCLERRECKDPCLDVTPGNNRLLYVVILRCYQDIEVVGVLVNLPVRDAALRHRRLHECGFPQVIDDDGPWLMSAAAEPEQQLPPFVFAQPWVR